MNTCPKCGQEIKENIKQVNTAKTLEWGAVSDKKMSWEDAKKWCEAQGKGWRLPTRVELTQAFDEDVLPNSGNLFWSSTEIYNNPAYAWDVDLNTGNTYPTTKVALFYVRCVRP